MCVVLNAPPLSTACYRSIITYEPARHDTTYETGAYSCPITSSQLLVVY